jgi:hypothetical protein
VKSVVQLAAGVILIWQSRALTFIVNHRVGSGMQMSKWKASVEGFKVKKVYRISLILAEIIVDTEYQYIRYQWQRLAVHQHTNWAAKDCSGVGQFSTGSLIGVHLKSCSIIVLK